LLSWCARGVTHATGHRTGFSGESLDDRVCREE
jgi:hypothetical protein